MLMDTVGSEMLLLFGKLGLRLGPLVPPATSPPSLLKRGELYRTAFQEYDATRDSENHEPFFFSFI